MPKKAESKPKETKKKVTPVKKDAATKPVKVAPKVEKELNKVETSGKVDLPKDVIQDFL